MVDRLLEKLRSENRRQIQQGLEGLAELLPTLDGERFEEAVQAIASLFYVDPIDHPELLPLLDQAEEVLASLRERVIPVILGMLSESDLKTHFHLAAALGRMGYAAVGPLLEAYTRSRDDYDRVFLLYALGKIRDPEVLRALPVLFGALEHDNPEIRDTAARALGKICEHVRPDRLPEEQREEMFERLVARVRDRFAGVRSKAVRSLGKMARFGFLNESQKARLREILAGILGEDDSDNWDVAYVVRAEAEKAKPFAR